MSKQRLVITAVLASQTQSDVARRYGVSQGWISKLMTRWRLEGEAAFEPRSRRPQTSPTATPPAVIELVIALRQRLDSAGLDAGADTIGWHLSHTHQIPLNRATIHRILTRHGLVEAEPKKRPKSSYLHFAAAQPNQCWQSDFTRYRLSTPDGRPGPDTEIITWLDDHSRYTAHLRTPPNLCRHRARYLHSHRPAARPTTLKPKAKSNAFNKHSTSGFELSPISQPRSPSCSYYWMSLPRNTTNVAHTAR
ncbi:transposase [Arthrobacter roseus]|nr:transposase [Arthrobacter roseus]